MKIHLVSDLAPWGINGTLCGRWAIGRLKLTAFVRWVTCKQCLKVVKAASPRYDEVKA